MSRKFAVVLIMSFVSQMLMAQSDDCELKLSGVVRGSDGQKTIPFATLQLIQEKRSTVSDKDGRFVFDNLCSKTFEVLVRFTGYKDYRTTYVINQADLDVEIVLQFDVRNLDAVTVEGEKADEIASLNTVELGEDELAKTSGESLGSSLSRLTGVNALQTGPTIAKPVIHGLHSNRVLILNNGIRQEGQQWGQEHAPEIDPFVASNLALIKGAAAVKYGSDAIGGVILVNPSELPTSAGIKGRMNMVGASNNKLYAGSALIEGGINGLDGFGWRLQGTYKRGGDARAPGYRLTNTGLSEENFSFGMGYHKPKFGMEIYYSDFSSEIGILSSAHNSSSSDFKDAIGRDRPAIIRDFSYDINKPKQVINHQLLKAFLHANIQKLGELKVLYGFQENQREEFDIRIGDFAQRPALSLTLNTHTLDLDLDIEPIGNWKSDVGLSYINQVNDNRFDLGVSPLIPNYDNYTLGGHAITRFIQPKYELEFGVRHDFKRYQIRKFDDNDILIRPKFNFSNTTGSVGFIFSLDDKTQFRSNVGTAWRAPNVNELFSDGLHHGAAAIEEGNEDLDSENSLKWVGNLEHNSDKVNLDISAYYNVISNYIYLRPEDISLTTRGAFPVFGYAQTDATFFGFDIDMIIGLGLRMNWINKLSFLHARDQENDGPLINIPANRFQTGLEYNFQQTKSVEEAYISIFGEFVNKQRNAPRVVTIDEIEDAKANSIDLFASSAAAFDILGPPAGYAKFDFTAGIKLPFKDDLSLGFILTIDNIFNTRYRDYLNRFRYYADEVGRNVSLKLNLNF